MNVIAEKPMKALSAGKQNQVHAGGDLQRPKLLSMVKPVYPAIAKEASVEGTVVLHVVIGLEGTPLSLRIMNSRMNPELARAAVEAVSKWRYSPTLLNRQPIENFKLS